MTDLGPVAERWFVRRGLPHFIVGYSAREDVFTRAAGLLTVVFLAELGTAFDFDLRLWQNVLAFAGTLGAVAAVFMLINRLRGRRLFQRLDSVGWLEVAAFVIVPPLIPEVISDQRRQAITVLVGNVALLAVVYLATSYAVLPILRWSLVMAARQVRDLANLMARSLPLMLLFSMFIFFSTELWQIVASLPTILFAAAVGLLVVIGSVFVLLRLPHETEALAAFESWDDVRERSSGTPLASLPVPSGAPVPVPLSRRERTNVGLVLFAGQAVQVLLVTALIGAFYTAFGLFTMTQKTLETWIGAPAHVFGRTWEVGGAHLFLSRELLLVAIFVAAISGLQFTVSALTDETYRREFYAEVTRDLRTAMAVRLLYRAGA